MGSLMEACCTGFICRLCSKMNRMVIFIYGADGLEYNLLQKINNYLPIEINEEDELPKTICEACLEKILLHHRLIEQIQSAQKRFVKLRDEDQARNATAAESAASSRTLSAESTASSRTMSVDSTDAVEEPAERIQETEPNNTESAEHSAAAETANARVQDDIPTNESVSQDSQEATSSSSTDAAAAGESSTNREQSEPGSSAPKPPPNRLKRKQPNPSHSSKVARKRLG
ncbi:protein P54-like [Anopheles marshallii]|uniref:protein P54-like n=1 Tax=Anopheles marshallii TaxID=1521116 RepID=UPI00237ABF2C|nr:protein P54-like [Anopheles marshallii]